MQRTTKRWLISLPALLLMSLLATSCKQKCYDCVVTNPDTLQKDTINTICTDDPQYTAGYLESWKAYCGNTGGETIGRDKE